MTKINVSALVELVIDGKKPDGSRATQDEILGALQLCHEHDEKLAEQLAVAKFGERLDGTPVAWEERDETLTTLAKLATSPAEHPVSHTFAGLADDLTQFAETRSNRRVIATHGLAPGAALRRQHDRTRAPETVRDQLETIAKRRGHDPAVLLAPILAGRPSRAEAARRDALSTIVRQAQIEGARIAEIAAALGFAKQRVSELAGRGRHLEAALSDGQRRP